MRAIRKWLCLFWALPCLCCGEGDHSGKSVTVGFQGPLQDTVWVKKPDGSMDIIVPPPGAEGNFEMAEPSPNQKFILLTVSAGDGGQVWVYTVEDGKLHEVAGGFGMGEMGWLEDNRLMLHQGCIMAGACNKLKSVDSAHPWILKITED